MTTTTLPAPAKPTLVPAPSPTDVDAFERAFEKTRRYITTALAPAAKEPAERAAEAAAQKAAVLLINELGELFKLARGEVGEVAQRADALVAAYEDEESLADHAEEYAEAAATIVLDLMLRGGYLDAEKGLLSTCPAEVEKLFKDFDEKTDHFRAHVQKTMTLEQGGDPDDGDGDGGDPDEPAAPTTALVVAPAPTPTPPPAPSPAPTPAPPAPAAAPTPPPTPPTPSPDAASTGGMDPFGGSNA